MAVMEPEEQRQGRTIIHRPPEPGPIPELKWHERLNVLNMALLVFLLAVVFSLPAMRGSEREMDYLGNFVRFAGYFFPPDFSVTGQTLIALRETFQIAVMATLFSILLSLPLAIAGAQTMSPRWLVVLARLVMNGIRTIPSLIWAVIAVAIVGPNPLAGVIALTLYSMGYLGKFFSDTFESVDFNVARGLRAIGADTVQSFKHGVWPYAKPFVWSHGLWMLEYNIRSAAIIGYVGAGGLGVQLHQYAEYRAWEKFATVLFFIFLLVSILDFLGEWIRKRIVRRVSGRPLAAK
jgi:phosphonate transport system permease protein